MSLFVTCPLVMSIPFVVIGLILFVNRKRLKNDFKAHPNAWSSGCFWIGLPLTFLSACFIGWLGWGTLNYYFGPRSLYDVWSLPLLFLIVNLLVMAIGVVLMVVGRKMQVKR